MKLQEFQQYLKKEKIDLALFTLPDAVVTYFAQCSPESTALIIITPKKVELYLTILEEKPKLKGVSVKRFKKGWDKKFKKLKIERLGVNKNSLTLASAEIFKKIFPKAEMVDVSEEIDHLRSQKTPEEIKKIIYACQVTDYAFKELIKNISKMKTELEVSKFLEEKMQEKGCSPAFPTIVASGKNAAIPHYNTSNARLGRGFLLLDFGAKYQNYNSDMSRTIFLGQPTNEEKDRYNLLLKIQKETIENIKEGKLFWELQLEVRKSLGKYSSHFIHLLGHGIGLDVHETPSFNEERKEIVQNNQIFTIEPGIYFYKKYGIRIEDTVLFNHQPQILTSSPKDLIIIKS